LPPATHQLVEFLLADEAQAADAARLLSESAAWREALELARAWKVTPQFSARIQSLGCELPAADTKTLKREFLKVYAQSASRASKAIVAIAALQKAKVAVVAFKGIASMAVLYRDPKRRTIGDADLLISRDDLTAALACLEASGFTRRGAETLEQYLQFVDHAPRFAGNKAIALYGEDGTEIDLHWEIAGSGLRVDRVLERARTAPLMGSNVPVVDSKDGFLLTVHHAIREDLGIENVCRDLLDAGLWCHHLRETGELEGAIARAVQCGRAVPALAVTSILGNYDDRSTAAQAVKLLRAATSAAEHKSAALLTELFYYQMGNGPIGKDVLYLVHTRPWRQIVKGLGSDWSGYLQSMQSMEKQMNEEMPLHERALQLAKSIPGLRTLRLARELARVKYRESKGTGSA